MRYSSAFLLGLSLFFLHCKKNDEVHFVLNNDLSFSDSLLRNATDSMTLNGHTLVLSAFVDRNFNLNGNDIGSFLEVAVILTTTDGSVISPDLSMKNAYIIHQNTTWLAEYTDRIFVTPPDSLERVSINGPKWPLDSFVTVICRIYASLGNHYLLLKTKPTKIEAVM